VKLHRDNASTLTPDPVYAAFYYSHPPPLVRITRLRGLPAAALGAAPPQSVTVTVAYTRRPTGE
jgi:STE24 endopeptidase